MMLLGFLPALFICLLVFIYPSIRFIGSICVLVSSISLVLLALDSHVYGLFKFHINHVLLSFIFNAQWRTVFDLSEHEIHLILTFILGILALECLAGWIIWKKIILTHRFKVGKTIALLWLGGALFSYFTLVLSIAQKNNVFSQQIPNLPFLNQMLTYTIWDKKAGDIILRYSEHHFSQPFFSNAPLHYPTHPLQCQKVEKPFNIVLIMVDTLRFDSLNEEYMPHVTDFAKQSWQFLHHMSGGNSTQPGLFSLFYSLPATYWTAVLKQQKSPVLLEFLRDYRYNFKVIWSSQMTVPPFDQVLYRLVKNLHTAGAPGNDVGEWDRQTTQHAIHFLKDNPKEPFFLNLFYDATHAYCGEQSFPTPYILAKSQCSRIAMRPDMDPKPFYHRYLNAVRFVDDQVDQVLQTLAKKGFLNNSIVIFTSDHGEEFNDNGQNYWGHAGNFTPSQIHIPLLIHWPSQTPQQITHQTTSYDIVPTLLKRVFFVS